MQRLQFSAFAIFSEFGSVAPLEILSIGGRESPKNVVVHAPAVSVSVERQSATNRPITLTRFDRVAFSCHCSTRYAIREIRVLFTTGDFFCRSAEFRAFSRSIYTCLAVSRILIHFLSSFPIKRCRRSPHDSRERFSRVPLVETSPQPDIVPGEVPAVCLHHENHAKTLSVIAVVP